VSSVFCCSVPHLVLGCPYTAAYAAVGPSCCAPASLLDQNLISACSEPVKGICLVEVYKL